MNNLTNNELMSVNGGAWRLGLAAAIAGGITFLIGIIDGFFRPLSCRQEDKMENKDLINIYGGAISINSTLINAAARLGTLILELGRSLGSAIYRSVFRKYCQEVSMSNEELMSVHGGRLNITISYSYNSVIGYLYTLGRRIGTYFNRLFH